MRNPDVSKDYPATLHINVEEGCRSLGIGGRLVDRFLAYLRERGVQRVHAVTVSKAACDFFMKRGFEILFKGKRSYFKHVLNRDTSVYVLGLRFEPHRS